MSEELKPCPFCRGTDSLDKRHTTLHNRYAADDELWSIECRACLFTTRNFETECDLLKYWNTRPAEDALKAEIERLKEALESICLVAAFPNPCPEYIEQVRGIAKEALDKMQIRTGRDG